MTLVVWLIEVVFLVWFRTRVPRKIQKAVDLREAGMPLRIVGADHWAAALSLSV